MKKTRYGFTAQEIHNLSKRWHKKVKHDTGWESFDSFLSWASVSGYSKGKNLRKAREEEPHGPGNSYWYSHGEKVQEKREKVRQQREITSRFCIGCQKKCSDGHCGCKEWQEWVVKNWNENIHVPQKGPTPAPAKPVREKFQYEHPDLVREGIVFESSRSL